MQETQVFTSPGAANDNGEWAQRPETAWAELAALRQELLAADISQASWETARRLKAALARLDAWFVELAPYLGVAPPRR